MSLLSLLSLSMPAFADCKPEYQRVLPLAVVGGVSSVGVGLSSTVAAYPTLVFGILGGALLKENGVIFGAMLLSGADLLGGAALSGTSVVLMVRRNSYAKVLALIEDSELGGGPALSAYVGDLNAVTGGDWSVDEVSDVVISLNDINAFCGPDGLVRYTDADSLIVQRLNGSDGALGPMAPGQTLP